MAPLSTSDLSLWARPGWPRLAVTASARTAVDCARHLPLHEALPLVDSAARERSTRAELARALAQQPGWPGAARARRALELADPLRESWLESVGASVLAGAPLPTPVVQAVVRAPGGRFVARVDHAWPELGVVAEADGWGECGDDPAAALRADERREDALRGLRLEVVRHEARDVVHRGTATGEQLLHRVLAARARADPRRLTATLTPTPPPPGW